MLNFDCAVRATRYDVWSGAGDFAFTMAFWASLRDTGCVRVFLTPLVVISRWYSPPMSASYITLPVSHVLRVYPQLRCWVFVFIIIEASLSKVIIFSSNQALSR